MRRTFPVAHSAVLLGLAIMMTLATAAASAGARPIIFGHTASDKTAQIDAAGSLLRRIAVFGPDGREPVDRELAFLRHSIGLLHSQAARAVCSAFCVGRRSIATAAHCLLRTSRDMRPNLNRFRFTVGPDHMRKSSSIAQAEDGSHLPFVRPGTTTVSVAPPFDASRDWALVRLNQPVCSGWQLPVGRLTPDQVDLLASKGRMIHVGFHGDLEDWQLTVTKDCRKATQLDARARARIARDFTDVGQLILHHCDTGEASSGSPLLERQAGGQYRVVGINVGTYRQTRLEISGEFGQRRPRATAVGNTAVASAAFARYIAPFNAAEILMRQHEMEELQEHLAYEGFDPGPIDGVFGPATRDALLAFARHTRSVQLGLATRSVLQQLRAARLYPATRRRF